MTAATTQAQTPCGLNHLVLNVRDIEESHWFWTELLGFRHVGTSRRRDPGGRPPMRFYSGLRDGKLRHHDIALVEGPKSQATRTGQPQALNHVAIEYPTLEAWRRQIAFLTARGVVLHRMVERGVTHSIHLTDPNGCEVELVHELPRAAWENDIDAALNRAVEHPHGAWLGDAATASPASCPEAEPIPRQAARSAADPTPSAY